ncbi:Protein of unknown function [Anaerosporobacter mobilis DSM 15930]|jgi:hypothetical protein|uniref:Thoeris anti-defense 2-like domain-containing protein n=1 Tax=Anaerosporobacter mobilis DSM 15930 TaxID=1120996 RepID=A0A1M7NJC8_9FIRM|nr:DUF2829 domain-containing protein [Anaerosporobacter mobilis]SHN03792.1 Protein of unknown function [Anaerosporobacter mobilis DSM 15930]
MKKYIGTKMLQATPMSIGDYNKYRGWTIPSNENPNDEGYLVEYEDGYQSWSPKEVFEKAYKECNGMVFGIAVELLKNGFKVARAGWNGKGMFIYYVPGARYEACTDIGASIADEENKVAYEPYLAIKNVKGTVSTWVPSINDCLAEDWNIVD